MAEATKVHVYATRQEKGLVSEFISGAEKLAGDGGQSQVVVGTDLRFHGDLKISVANVDEYMQSLLKLMEDTGFVSDPKADIVRVKLLDGPRANEMYRLGEQFKL